MSNMLWMSIRSLPLPGRWKSSQSGRWEQACQTIWSNQHLLINDLQALESLVGHLVHASKVCPLSKASLISFVSYEGMQDITGGSRQLLGPTWDGVRHSWPPGYACKSPTCCDTRAYHMLGCLDFSHTLCKSRLRVIHAFRWQSYRSVFSQQCSCILALLESCFSVIPIDHINHINHINLLRMQSNSRLDFAAVEDAVQQLLEAGLAPSTRKTYAAGWKHYQSFTSAFSLAVFPIIHKKVTLFVVFLGTEKLTMSTVKTCLSALWHFRILSNPFNSFPSLHTPTQKSLPGNSTPWHTS